MLGGVRSRLDALLGSAKDLWEFRNRLWRLFRKLFLLAARGWSRVE